MPDANKISADQTRMFFRSLTMREFAVVMRFYRIRRKLRIPTTIKDARDHLNKIFIEETKRLAGNEFDLIEEAA